MDLEIISKEFIKPSSPTPSNLRTHKLCLFDQYVDHSYASCVHYYPLNHNISLSNSSDIDHIVSERLQLLKQSLSETLTHFYTLGGNLKDDYSVDCNDEGVYFVEARTKSSLKEFLNQPNLSLLSKFIPEEGNERNGRIAGARVDMIQVTIFACGGLAIGNTMAHMVADGMTIGLFLKCWAAIASKNMEAAIFPNYNSSLIFPPVDEDPKDAAWRSLKNPFLKTGRPATRRFVFDAKSMANLKARATSSGVQNPSRSEAVSAFLFKQIMVAFKTKSGFHKPHLLSHVVNLRRKIKPSIIEYSLGNILWHANALCTEDEVELDGLVYGMREAIAKYNGDFVKSLQGDEGFVNFRKAIKDDGEVCCKAADRVMFTSWCNFGFYDVDFGWGKPIWMSSVGWDELATTFYNFIILNDTRLRDGVEAWVLLPEEDMALLELDKELLAFATMDPSPFDI
ncbi:vinorine synthase-like [Melia azedarach]|uniref:Vinorine synthase-like n=1 Tax=Melia azedarach TaxID=155640 RepID=A0ACC1XX86_MELAZ|nr:vinorine synthase-like [Melia azedarach]